MKQVYTQQKETQTASVRAHVKAWVLFIGFLVWLVAVKETFGQSANSSANKANTRLTELSPLAGACNIQVSAALQYMDGQGRYKSFALMQSQQITFRLRDVNKVIVASAVGTTNGNGVATAQLDVPATAVQLEAEYAGGDLYKKTSLTVDFKVEDKIAPVVSARSGVTLALDDAGKATLTVANVVSAPSSDACGIKSEVLSRTAFDCAGKGTHTVKLTVTDHYNNVTERDVTVTVVDHMAPVPAVASLPVLTGECSVKATAPQALDNCAGLLTAATTSPLEYTQQGSYIITWRYNDGNGNVTEQQQQVVVKDETNPVITDVPADLTVAAGANCQTAVSWAAPKAADNCELVSFTPDVAPGTIFGLGTRKVTYTATDKAGNVSKASFLVTVEDKTAPAVAVKNTTLALDGNGNATLALDSVRVSSTDNCGILAEVLSQTAFDCSHVGTSAVTLTVTDNNGNVTQKTVTVTVQDKIAPNVQTRPATLQLVDNGTALLSLNHVRVSSTDNCDIRSEVLSQTAFGCDNLGDNQVLLTVTDVHGNVTTTEVIVTVEDKTFPAIHGMPANVTLLAGANCQAVASWIEPTFSDNCGIKISGANHPSGSAFGLGVTTVTYKVEDNSGNVSEASFTVTVTNAAPQLTQIEAPATPVAVINAVPVRIGFADNNLMSAVIEWGDGSSSSYAADNGSPVIAGSHTYAMPGLYSLKVTLTDACGAQASGTYEYVMVNAPADGFITGGGWINSPAGALTGSGAMGKASYGFNARYNPATGISSGSATFDFPAGALNFASTRIDWLVVADARAWIKGAGTVNGVSGYSFLLSAVDSELNGYRNADTFRMQIWNQNGALVYDNQVNAPRNAPAAQVIAGGSIVVHKAKETAAASSNRLANGATGTEKVSLGLKAYPNPSAGNFTVTANETLTADAQVTVLDLRGQPVYRGVLEANGGRTLEVNLAGKQTGLYVVQVQAGGQREVLKLVKQ